MTMLSEYYGLRTKAILTIKHVLKVTPYINLVVDEDYDTLPTATDLKGVKYNIVLVSEEGFKGESKEGDICWFRSKDLSLFDLCIIAEILDLNG